MYLVSKVWLSGDITQKGGVKLLTLNRNLEEKAHNCSSLAHLRQGGTCASLAAGPCATQRNIIVLAPSSFLFLVVSGATSSVLVPSSDAKSR